MALKDLGHSWIREGLHRKVLLQAAPLEFPNLSAFIGKAIARRVSVVFETETGIEVEKYRLRRPEAGAHPERY